MIQDTDIVIVGGGLNGPALALALGDAGFAVTLIDALPAGARGEEAFDGRGYALAHASQRLLRAIGVWASVADHAEPLREIKISDGKPGQGVGPFVLEFDHAEIDEGPMGYMVEDRFLSRALAGAVSAHPRVTLLSETKVVAQEVGPAGATVTLDTGDTIRAALIVGCDGRRSGTCARAGIKRWGHDYGQTALVCAISHELPHHGTAHQFFLPPGPLAILPLPKGPEGHQSSIVWTETATEAARVHALPDAEYLDHLRPRFGDFLGEISLAGERFTYPLNLTVAERFIAERVALVGDAAHGMHPLERYQQLRRFDVTQMVAATEIANRVFSNDNPFLRLGRDLALGAINAMPTLRRSFIREAAGLTGDLPKLLQGRQI